MIEIQGRKERDLEYKPYKQQPKGPSVNGKWSIMMEHPEPWSPARAGTLVLAGQPS